MKAFNSYFGTCVTGLKIAIGVLAIFILIVAFDNTMNMGLAGTLPKTAVFILLSFYAAASLLVLRFIYRNIKRCIIDLRS